MGCYENWLKITLLRVGDFTNATLGRIWSLYVTVHMWACTFLHYAHIWHSALLVLFRFRECQSYTVGTSRAVAQTTG
jgi:hypothetical protein